MLEENPNKKYIQTYMYRAHSGLGNCKIEQIKAALLCRLYVMPCILSEYSHALFNAVNGDDVLSNAIVNCILL